LSDVLVVLLDRRALEVVRLRSTGNRTMGSNPTLSAMPY